MFAVRGNATQKEMRAHGATSQANGEKDRWGNIQREYLGASIESKIYMLCSHSKIFSFGCKEDEKILKWLEKLMRSQKPSTLRFAERLEEHKCIFHSFILLYSDYSKSKPHYILEQWDMEDLCERALSHLKTKRLCAQTPLQKLVERTFSVTAVLGPACLCIGLLVHIAGRALNILFVAQVGAYILVIGIVLIATRLFYWIMDKIVTRGLESTTSQK